MCVQTLLFIVIANCAIQYPQHLPPSLSLFTEIVSLYNFVVGWLFRKLDLLKED